MRLKITFLALFFLAGAFALYGRSLSYEFVYDDVWRIETNPSIRRLSNAPLFFTDRTTQSSHPALHRDSYRPLCTLYFAFQYALWGDSPAGYRLGNILLHAANALFVALVGIFLFQFSVLAAGFAGLVFLCHPIQTEAVVWLVEAANLLGTAFILAATLAWIRYRESKKSEWLLASFAFFVLGLFTRETAVCFPVLALFIDLYRGRERKLLGFNKADWRLYGGMILPVGIYLALRQAVIGQFKISPFWGGDVLANFANVFKTWTLYVSSLVWPRSLRVTYGDLPVADGFFQLSVVIGFFLILVFLFVAAISIRRRPRLSFCLFGLILFWLPGANIVPLTTLFAERLVYPLVVFWGLLASLIIDSFKTRHLKRIAVSGLAVYISVFSVRTWHHLPVWRNEHTLWLNATKAAPQSWFAWACLGQEESKRAFKARQDNHLGLEAEWLNKAEQSLVQSLKIGAPVDSAGNLFFALAKVNYRQGKHNLAQEHARRAFQLRPDLEEAWSTQRNDVVVFPKQPQ